MKRQLKSNRNRGLTLVELLVSISLIVIVAGMFMVAYRQAATEASNIRTQSTIRKISEVLVSRMQEYENYPINFARSPNNLFTTPIPGNAVEALPQNNEEFEPKGILLERVRVMLLREMIAQEMPDHYQDLPQDQDPPVRNYWTGLVVPPNRQVWVTASQSPRSARLKVKLMQAAASAPGQPSWRAIANNPELLYLIVEDSNLNGSPAIELFGKTEIGDTDNDGLLEFLDSNRRPIYWVRWPTGFPETTRFHPDLLDPSFNVDGFSNYAFSDPMDPRKSDPGYRIKQNGTPVFKPSAIAFPLVLSPGLDGIPGVRLELQQGLQASGRYQLLANSSSTTAVLMPVPYDNGGQYPVVMCDPWFPRTDPTLRLGAIINAKLFEDDITNYSINGAYQ